MQKRSMPQTYEQIEQFLKGENYEAWKLLGAHWCDEAGEQGVCFRVWAPRAQAVSVVGDFNSWNPTAHPMQPLGSSGIWERFVPHLQEYELYKYCITTPSGEQQLKADPYALHTQTRPENASKIYRLQGYAWQDDAWQNAKKQKDPITQPLNIYEVHLGSWRRHADGNVYSYRNFADAIIPYVQEMGYTHIELLPITEHPYDGSWGYQVSGYFAPTSRYGTPHDLMYLIDQCHQAGIGVILDWVPAHFPKDSFGLYRFDGTPCYEDANPQRAEHREWGTMVFDFGRLQVQSFLISSALFWLEQYHIDGLRFDAVASMLYLDYNRKAGEWQPNCYGGRENLEAVEFLRKVNTVAFGRNAGIMMIAEESTAWPLVSAPVYDGGLGFNFKWNMGWMNDMLSYMRTDPVYRSACHDKITFSFLYAFSEKFVLPISHDEVVHAKGSLMGKMQGSYEERFAELRTFFGYMIAHPGKKLLFMGQEMGQFTEWSEARQLDWNLLDYPSHAALQRWCCALNHFYLQEAALWQCDASWEGFSWIVPDDREQNIVVFIRRDVQGNELIACCNFALVKRENYCFGVPKAGLYREVLTSDDEAYGGSGVKNGAVQSQKGWMHHFEDTLCVTLPALSTVFFRVPGPDDEGADSLPEPKAAPKALAQKQAEVQSALRPKKTRRKKAK